MLEKIYTLLEEKKAFDIVSLDIRNKNFVADYIVIASGNSSKHIQTLASFLVQELKAYSPFLEGATSTDWVLIDVGSIIVHLFRPESRAFYDLEGMWQDCLVKSS